MFLPSQVIRDTNFLNELYNDDELNADNIKDRDGKIKFLSKLIDVLSILKYLLNEQLTFSSVSFQRSSHKKTFRQNPRKLLLALKQKRRMNYFRQSHSP